MENIHELDLALFSAMSEVKALAAKPACDLAALSQARYRVARAIGIRRQAIDRLVNATIAAGGASGDASRTLRSGNLDTRMLYTDHVSAWPITRAAAEWPAYIEATRRLGETIRRQLQIERDLLYRDAPPIPDAAP